MKELVRLENIKRHYVMPGFTVKALDGVDISIAEKSFAALQ
jgi:ABC-type oligopeptide transport system ATPase subunit